jgi:metal-responsive CopG/Arc/MetJ family transcriptional regulator
MSPPSLRGNRTRVQVMVTLSPEALAAVDDLANRSGSSRSALVEMLIRDTCRDDRDDEPSPKSSPKARLTARGRRA